MKRELKNANPSKSELDLERMCSQALASRHEHNSKEIDFKVDFVLVNEEESAPAAAATTQWLQMRFTLLHHLPSNADLVDFDTLVHFVHVFSNTSLEKCFSQWLLSH